MEGRAQSIIQISRALGNLFGGLIGSISLGATLIATSFSNLISFFVWLSIPKTQSAIPTSGSTAEYLKTIKESLKIIKNNKKLLWLTVFFASFNSLVWPLNFYAQPYLKALGVPVFLFGFVFMSFSLVSALGSSLTNRFENLFKGGSFVVFSLVSIVALFLLGRFPSLYVFPLWSLFITFAFMNQTIVSDTVLKVIPYERSAQSYRSRAFYTIVAIVGPVLGLASDTLGINEALILYSLFMTIVFSVVLIKSRPAFD